MFETIKGTVQRIVFASQDTGFKVFRTRMPSGPVVSMTGEVGPDVIVGTIASFNGQYRNHPKYGTSFRVASYDVEHDEEQVSSFCLFIDFIAPNVGAVRAKALVDYFGEEFIDVLDNWPNRLEEVPGIGKITADSLRDAWTANRDQWEISRQEFTLRAFLYGLGIKERRVKKILAFFGGGLRAESSIRENPYVLAEVDGFGFSTADHVANKLGMPMDSSARVRAFIHYTLAETCTSNGHLFFTVSEIAILANAYCGDNATQFLGLPKVEITDLAPLIDEMVKEGRITKDEDALYNTSQYALELRSAQLLAGMMTKNSDLVMLNRTAVDKFISEFEVVNGITLSEEQRRAMHYFVTKKVLIVTGSPGTGKCLGVDTPVMMYDGSIKPVQDIVVGEQLMGDDSTPRTVQSTCIGQGPLYKVTPVKGDPYIVNDAHILTLKYSGQKTIKDIPLLTYLNMPQKVRWKGIRVPVDFEEKAVPLSPYFLGYWLGNGESAQANISSPFPEVLKEIGAIIKPYGLSLKKKKGKGWVDYGISRDLNSAEHKSRIHKKLNPIVNLLTELGVLNNKHVPHLYKANSKEIRMRVLAGLLDSDGDYSTKDNVFSITFKSKRLIDDTCFLARSLGFSAYVKPVIKKWTSPNQGNKYVGEGLYYTMCICGAGIENIPTIVGKKRARPRTQIKDVLVTGITVTPMGVGDYYGFEIDGNRRFLLGDFTVTHNTLITKALVGLCVKMKLNFVCMTPTGISAKKMATTIGHEASTIHRRLMYRGDSWGYGEENQFEADVVFIDESSMVDQDVFYHLVASLRDRTHLVLIGDDYQLPSVGAGNVLRELINCQAVPTVRLETIFRQNEASDIIRVAHKIKKGDPDLSLFKPDPTADVFFYRETNIQKLEAFIVKIAQKFKDERRIFQIITPRNEGPLSVASLNKTLQEVLNPPAEGVDEMAFREGIMRRGDRIMVKKNDYDNGIYNGDVGKVLRMGGGGNITILVDDREITLPIEGLDEKLKLAYAITVHGAQGQEYPYVILPFINQHGKNLLQRNLLYTAITRAKKKVIAIGHGSAIERAINNASVSRRNTKLGYRVRNLLGEPQEVNPEDFAPKEQITPTVEAPQEVACPEAVSPPVKKGRSSSRPKRSSKPPQEPLDEQLSLLMEHGLLPTESQLK